MVFLCLLCFSDLNILAEVMMTISFLHRSSQNAINCREESSLRCVLYFGMKFSSAPCTVLCFEGNLGPLCSSAEFSYSAFSEAIRQNKTCYFGGFKCYLENTWHLWRSIVNWIWTCFFCTVCTLKEKKRKNMLLEIMYTHLLCRACIFW